MVKKHRQQSQSSQTADTIIATATPAGRGAIGIVRVSGPASFGLAAKLTARNIPARRAMKLANFYNPEGDLVDRGLVLSFPAPNSFSGEDMIEFHTHGNPLILNQLIASGVAYGARHAEPGEFSRRAYQNGKLDLAQAEAIATLINSTTAASLRAAMKSLTGEFSAAINQLQEQLLALRTYVEACLDFPTEELELLEAEECRQRTSDLLQSFSDLLAQAQQGSLLTENLQLALIGKPNAGKSSLLNFLCRSERAIVSQQAGTTRDFIQESLSVQGLQLTLTDTAGIRTTARHIEQQGIAHTWQQAELSDLIILIYDAAVDELNSAAYLDLLRQQTTPSKALAKQPKQPGLAAIISQLASRNLLDKVLIVANKVDLLPPAKLASLRAELAKLNRAVRPGNQPRALALSVHQTKYRPKLLAALAKKCGRQDVAPHFSARRRHLESLEQALNAVREGYAQLEAQGAGELFAADLKRANDYLAGILGETTPDALLDRIFADFCIGK